jgi:exopolysaccharide biosynthesis polyprenyl glycosylphosphotransferase
LADEGEIMQSVVTGNESFIDAPLTLKVRQASRSIPRHIQWRLLIGALFLVDFFMLGLAFRLAYYVRFTLNISIFQEEAVPVLHFYETIVFFLIPVWLAIFVSVGLYNRKNLLGGTREYAKVFNATAIGMFFMIVAGFLLPEFVYARGWLILSGGLAFTLVAFARFLMRRAVYALRGQGYFLSPAIIVGANDEGRTLASQFLSWRTSGFLLTGFIDKKLSMGEPIIEHLRCLGNLTDLDSVVKKYDIEEIILASSAFSSRDGLLDIFKRYGVASGISVRLSSGLYEIITTGLTVNEFAYVPLVEVNQVRLSGFDRVLKGILDYSLTLPAVILLSPLFLAVGVAIKLDSPGPVFHRRRVKGVNGREFGAFKFRTMHVNGDEILAQHPELKEELDRNHKLKNDPRITRVGGILRKWSIDEFPQFFNVLLGDMSIVGPRMISPEEISEYNQWDINLLTVRPGITGLWQVSGRSDVTYDQRVRYDMHYIRNWNIWLDLQLMFQTIPTVIKRRGAY